MNASGESPVCSWERDLFVEGMFLREPSMSAQHFVSGRRFLPPFSPGLQAAVFGMGCFWGAERCFWELDVYATAVGYSGGDLPCPSYQDVCSGGSGHAEVVLVIYDPAAHPYADLLKVFWEGHDPTQGMRQGNDVGPQYRSLIYTIDAGQFAQAQASCRRYQQALEEAGAGRISTEIRMAPRLFYAESHHQQYLAKNPSGYCGLGGTGIPFPALG